MTKQEFLNRCEIITETGCWLWFSRRTNTHRPYAHTVVDGRVECAHRLSWWIHNGEIPCGGLVLHKCDVKACINPAHLYIGNKSDNSKDSFARGFRKKRETFTVKFSDEQVRYIRASKQSYSALAREFRVWPQAIEKIKNRKTYRWVVDL